MQDSWRRGWGGGQVQQPAAPRPLTWTTQGLLICRHMTETLVRTCSCSSRCSSSARGTTYSRMSRKWMISLATRDKYSSWKHGSTEVNGRGHLHQVSPVATCPRSPLRTYSGFRFDEDVVLHVSAGLVVSSSCLSHRLFAAGRHSLGTALVDHRLGVTGTASPASRSSPVCF